MHVYPTRRSAAFPEDVLAEVKKHAGIAKTDGYHVRDVGRSTVPFPVPENGLQVMWNHVFRWRGGSVERQYVWAPVEGSGKFYVVKYHQNIAFDQHGYMAHSNEGRLYNATGFFLAPPAAIGVRVATWEPIDPAQDVRARWVFLPQTLDTRRVPSYDYDMQPLLTGGRITADQVDGWNGAPDCFEWKLVGKRELLIGYNAYRLADRSLRYPDIIKPRNLDPELLRYERHRVWVVEATRVKHHKFYRRVFYVDEDTWQVAQEEIYDKKGNARALRGLPHDPVLRRPGAVVRGHGQPRDQVRHVPGDLPQQHGALPHALGVHGPDERLHPEPPAQPGPGVGRPS